MISEFAQAQIKLGANGQLDVWVNMPDDFQAFDADKQSSRKALSCIRSAIDCHIVLNADGSAQKGAAQGSSVSR